MSQKIIWESFSYNKVKNKVTSGFNKPAHVEMCVLDLSKVSTNKFHYD